MIAIDTNVLVYAHVDTFAKHAVARDELTRLAEGATAWAIPSPCLGEFVRVVTHPRILEKPYSVEEAVEALDAVLASPSLAVLHPGEQYWSYFADAAREADARGNLAFDAVIVATCRESGATSLLTEDRDFARFQGFSTRRLGEKP